MKASSRWNTYILDKKSLPEAWVVLFPNKLDPCEVAPPNNPPPAAGVVEPKDGVPNVPAAGVVLPKRPPVIMIIKQLELNYETFANQIFLNSNDIDTQLWSSQSYCPIIGVILY